MDPKIYKKTQDTLGKIIKKPPLTDKLLGKPPFRFLHDIITSVIKTTGFMQGLFNETEMNSENVKDKEAKVVFLQKAIAMVCAVTSKDLSVKPVKIVAGHEPERTNEFLQALADAIVKNVDNDEYVKRVLKGGKGGASGSSKEEKREDKKEKLKSEDKKKAQDSEEKDERKQSSERGNQDGERKRERDRENDKHKEKEKRLDKDRDKDRHGEKRQEKDGEKDRERHKDPEREAKSRDKSREGRGHDREGDRDRDRHKNRERDSKPRDKSREERHKEKDAEKSKKSITSEKERQTGTAVSSSNGAKLSQQHSEVSLHSKRESQKTQRLSDVQMPRLHEPPLGADAYEARGRHSVENLTRHAKSDTPSECPTIGLDAFDSSEKLPPVMKECGDTSALEVEASAASLIAGRHFSHPASKRNIAKHSSRLSCTDTAHTLPVPDIQHRESLATGDHWSVTSDRDQSRDKENESPNREKMNGDKEEKQEPPTRLQRPSSAKGTRRRREGQLNGDDQGGFNEDDDEVMNQREPMLGEGDLPPQVIAARQLGRPSSARPAPPRPKQDTLESEPAMRLGTGHPTHVIGDNDGADDDDDDNFLVQETVPPPPEQDLTPLKPIEDQDTQHGALVQKMLESKKEVERGSQGSTKKTEIERPLISDAQRRKQRETVQKEVDKLRGSIQSLTRSANPLGKVMDYVQEDMDSMQQELDKWRSENAQHALDLKREMSVTDRAVDPLRQQLAELDRAISDQLDRIAATKSNIIRNDQKIQKMLRGISSS